MKLNETTENKRWEKKDESERFQKQKWNADISVIFQTSQETVFSGYGMCTGNCDDRSGVSIYFQMVYVQTFAG